jgi:hypothetical protein
MNITAISIVLASPAFSLMVHPTGTSCEDRSKHRFCPMRPVQTWQHGRHSRNPPPRTDGSRQNTDSDLSSDIGRSDQTKSRKTRRFSRVRSRAACIFSDEGVVANVTADMEAVVGVVLTAVTWPGADGWVEAAGGVEVDANDADAVDNANVAGADEACGVEVLELEIAVVT